MIKTGIGYDVHKLKAGFKLVLGGVEIPSEFGAVGHSDGDVLIHAVVDALLGAANLGDIGKLFPSSDDQWKDADSRRFLKITSAKIRQLHFDILHVDSIVILQAPRLAEFLPQMQYQIAHNLQVDQDAVSIKATTTDHLGYLGEKRGLAAQAIATLQKN
ncbi:MAG: 2-C-methyl-D-erythritol 2,4-cyclodiphosphate synthase [Candidatus Neomarinimicrobiota bacterium]